MKLYNMFEIVLIVVIITSVQGEGAQDSSCLNKLIPCVDYLNGTKNVPDSCCKPLKSLIKSEPKCLCSLISKKSTSRAKKAGIDMAAAQDLPLKCGLRVNPLLCLSGSTSSKSSEQSSGAGFSLLPLQSLLMILVACVIVPVLINYNILWL